MVGIQRGEGREMPYVSLAHGEVATRNFQNFSAQNATVFDPIQRNPGGLLRVYATEATIRRCNQPLPSSTSTSSSSSSA